MKKSISFILFFLLLCSFAYAEKVELQINEVTETNALTVVYPQFLYFHEGRTLNLSFDILDSNFTRLVEGEVNCSFYSIKCCGVPLSSGHLEYNSYWYYTLTSTDTTETGTYSFYVHCNATNGENGFVSESFEITTNGREETATPLLSLILMIALLIAFYMYIIKNYDIELFKENGAIKIFFILVSFWITLIPFYIFIIYNDYFGIGEVSDIMYSLWPYFIWLNVGITFYFMIYFVVSLLRELWDTAERRK